MELLLGPMVDDAKEAVGSMGDDSPLAVITDKPRTISHFFRQNFSQVTNPPIDSLRERHVMSLKTRFSNLANILEEESQNSDVLALDSPVLLCDDWSRLKKYFGKTIAEIDCTFPADGPHDALRAAIGRIRDEAEIAVRAGQTELFLSDENIGPGRIGIASVLAAAAVHTHLVRKGLRSYASINVRTAECLDPHYFAVLIGVGATTVNAYLAEVCIADRHVRGLFGERPLADCLERYRTAVCEGLLKIMRARWASRSSRPIAAAIISRPWVSAARWSTTCSPACRRKSRAKAMPRCNIMRCSAMRPLSARRW